MTPLEQHVREALQNDPNTAMYSRADILTALRPLLEQQAAAVAAYKRLIPQECCLGCDPNCHGPRGCLIRAAKAEFTPADALVAQIETLTADNEELIAQNANLTLVADGVNHDSRCARNAVTGCAGEFVCLRCQVETLTAELDEARGIAVDFLGRMESQSRYVDSGDPARKKIAAWSGETR